MKNFSYIYGFILLLHLTAILMADFDWVLYVSKPALAGSLIIYYFLRILRQKPKSFDWTFTLGLLFCLVGDILLMLEDLFLPGLVTFLVAQLWYAISFFQSTQGRKGFVLKQKWLVIPFFLYGLGMVLTLERYAPDFLPAIIAYSLFLLIMAMMAINRFQAVQDQSFAYVGIGATLFVISDSILALDKFANEIPYARFLIMLTYGLALYLMTYGMAQFREKG